MFTLASDNIMLIKDILLIATVMHLSSYLEQLNLAVHPSPGDHQLDLPALNLDQVKQLLLTQTLNKPEDYLPFALPSCS